MPTVCASEYGGPHDPTSGTHGYHGDDLRGRMAFAELNMGTALGNLPYKAKVRIEYGGRSVVAEKLDIGLGGSGCGGHSRAIDLWYETAQALGFSGLAPVNVTGVSGNTPTTKQALFGVPGTPSIPGESAVPNPLEAVPGVGAGFKLLEFPLKFTKQILAFFKLFFTEEGWIRVGKVLLGAFLLLSGIMGMAKINAGEKIVGAGHKALDVAAIAG